MTTVNLEASKAIALPDYSRHYLCQTNIKPPPLALCVSSILRAIKNFVEKGSWRRVKNAEKL
jgi:hypothetical protein